MRVVLISLPYAGLILTTVSVIWGLTHELYTKDETNKRHLTRAGKYSIVFSLLGLFISLNTGVLKTITDNQERENAKQETARKEQATALKELAQRQLEESRAQQSREDARKTQEKIDRDTQEGRQRDLELAQQQLKEFGKAESAARQRTMAVLQRSNNILRDVLRTQYPFTSSIRVKPTIRLSWDYPGLKELSEQIMFNYNRGSASNIVLIDNIQEDQNFIFLDKDFKLFERVGAMPEPLRNPSLKISIYGKGSDYMSDTTPDIRIIYVADVIEGEKPGEGIGMYTVRYYFTSGSYLVEAPPVTIEPATLSTGRITSVLALSGTTLRVDCGLIESDCKHVSLKSLNMQIPGGWEIVIDGKLFKRLTVKGSEVLVHTFDPNEEEFLEKYSLFRRH